MRARTSCAICRGKLRLLHDFGESPLANGYSAPDARYALTLMQCQRCRHIQLKHVIDPVLMFSDYAYSAGTGGMQRALFADLIASADAHFPVASATVVDVGANDNTLCDAFKVAGARAIGVDPYADTDYKQPWDQHTAASIRDEHDPADIITCTNTFAHLDNLHEAAGAFATLLQPNGYAIIQVPWVRDMLVNALYDTVYHEHLHYFSVKTLRDLFRQHWLDIVDVEYLPKVHGGTLRVFVQHAAVEVASASRDLLEVLEAPVLGQARRFAQQVAAHQTAIQQVCEGYDTVWAFGASAKATMLLAHNDLNVSRIFDDTEAKVGKMLPGTELEVEAPLAALTASEMRAITIVPVSWPSAFLITAWNYAPRITKRLRVAGFTGDIIVPFPTPYVIHDTSKRNQLAASAS